MPVRLDVIQWKLLGGFLLLLGIFAVDGWLASVDAAAGAPVDQAMVRLGLAVSRGLLLDLVATGDEAGVDEAAARFAMLLARRAPRRVN